MRAIVHCAALFVLRATKSFVDQSIRSTYLASMVHRYIRDLRYRMVGDDKRFHVYLRVSVEKYGAQLGYYSLVWWQVVAAFTS